MKTIYFYIASFLLLLSLDTLGRPNPFADTNKVKKGVVQIRCKMNNTRVAAKDSVLIIFDRWNRTDPGTVYKIFYWDRDGQIILPPIPVGKYYVTLQCLGRHRDRFETTIRIHHKKERTLMVRPEDGEIFSQASGPIPASPVDFSNLAIFRK